MTPGKFFACPPAISPATAMPTGKNIAQTNPHPPIRTIHAHMPDRPTGDSPRAGADKHTLLWVDMADSGQKPAPHSEGTYSRRQKRVPPVLPKKEGPPRPVHRAETKRHPPKPIWLKGGAPHSRLRGDSRTAGGFLFCVPSLRRIARYASTRRLKGKFEQQAQVEF